MFIEEIRINLDDDEHIQKPIQIEELKPPEVSFRMLEHTNTSVPGVDLQRISWRVSARDFPLSQKIPNVSVAS